MSDCSFTYDTLVKYRDKTHIVGSFVGFPLDAEELDVAVILLVNENADRDIAETPDLVKIRHQLIHTITTRLDSFNLNTVVSGFMEFNNKLLEISGQSGVDCETLKAFVQLIAPFAPHIAEELWAKLGGTESVFLASWPQFDEALMAEDTVEIAVQVNGKVRGTIEVAKDADKDAAISAAKTLLGDKLSGTIVKEIYVPGKIVNIVAK